MSSAVVYMLKKAGTVLLKPAKKRAKKIPYVRRSMNSLGLDRVNTNSMFDEVYDRTYAEWEKGKDPEFKRFFKDKEVRIIFRKSFPSHNKSYFLKQCSERCRGLIESIMDKLDYNPCREYDSFASIFYRLVDESNNPTLEIHQHLIYHATDDIKQLRQDYSGLADQLKTATEYSTPFISARAFFAPFLSKQRHFNHLQKFVGRRDYLDRLSTFTRDASSSVLVLTGRGGLGKSKLLLEYSEQQDITRSILFLSDEIPLKQEHFALLTKGEYVLIVDDAHKFDDMTLKSLLSFVDKSKGRVKLILSSRPQGSDFIRFCVSQAGFDLREVQFLELSDLTLDEVRDLARQILGPDFVNLVDRLAHLTQDCPLVTVVGGYLLRERSVDPALLEQDEDFIYHVLNRFQDELLGKISERVDPIICQKILNLFAAVAPVDMNHRAFVRRASEFTHISESEFIILADELEANGVLLRRGRLYRVTPDVFSDHMLRQACITRRDVPTGYANEVYEYFVDVCGEQVLRNLSELDWRMTVARKHETQLLDEIWHEIEARFRSGGVWERIQLIQQIKNVAYYQPQRSLALSEYAIRHPLPDESVYCTHQQLLDEVAVVLQYVGFTVDYLPHVLDVLWEIGCHDSRATNSNPQHPMRIIHGIASYSRHKSVLVHDIVLDAVERWIGQPHAHDHFHSPLKVVSEMFSKVGEDTHSENNQVVMSAFLVSEEKTRALRQRAINILRPLVNSDDTRIAVHAICALDEALRNPFPILNVDIPNDFVKSWHPQIFEVFEILKERVRANPDPYVCIAICQAVAWHAEHNDGEPEIQEKAIEVISTIPRTFEFNLTKALCFSLDKDWMPYDVDFKEVLRSQTERADSLWAEYVREYVVQWADPYEMLNDLKARIALIKSLDLPCNPHLFLDRLAKIDPNYTMEICRVLINDGITDMLYLFAPFLAITRGDKPEQAFELYRHAIDSETPSIRSAAAEYLAHLCMGELDESELVELEKLLAHSDERVVLFALSGLEWYGRDKPGYLVRQLIGFKIGTNMTFAEKVCSIVLYTATLDIFDDKQLEHLIADLKSVSSLSTESVSEFLHEASKRVPDAVVDLYLDRILDGEVGERYEALPYNMRTIISNPQSDRYLDLLRKARERVLDIDAYQKWDVAKVYAHLSNKFDESSLIVLKEWVDTKEDVKFEAVIELLRDAPNSFVFEHVEFVRHLIDEAMLRSSSLYDLTIDRLVSVAFSGQRQGVPGKPFPQDVYVQQESQRVAEGLIKGSPEERFYSTIAQLAKKRVDTRMD